MTLLLFPQERYQRVGRSKARHFEFAVIAATNRLPDSECRFWALRRFECMHQRVRRLTP